MSTKRMDADESRLFERIQELCSLCAEGIVKISKEFNIHPKFVAEMFMKVMQTAIDKM